MKELRLIRLKKNCVRHVSLSDVDEFEESILELDNLKVLPEFNNSVLKKIAKPDIVSIINKALPKYQSPLFYIAMGVSEANRSLPYSLLSSNNFLFLFDAWPKQYEKISKIVAAYNISTLFVTSKESAIRLSVLLPKTGVYWIPEGCRSLKYRPYAFDKKDIDVMQFGRKYDKWHDLVADGFNKLKITYLYEKEKGNVIFNNREDFIDGLGRTRISICFPKSVTHSHLSGGISTMTYRYLQSMASKCLILGSAPDDMKEVFGYDPVISVDFNDPVGQVDYILKNFHDYEPLVEKNYLESISNHSWYARWKKIVEIINQ